MTSRVLRIGVLVRDTLVEEKLVTRAPVTLGQSLRCTLSLPLDGLPREHVLITSDGGKFLLHTPSGADCRLGHGDHIVCIAGERTVALERGARGKLQLGDVTLLFQELAARPPAPRPQLPASVRGTLADRVDRRLAVIIGGSLVVHVAIAAWAWSADIDTGNLFEPRVAQRYEQQTIDVTLPDLTPPPIATSPAPGIATPPLASPRSPPRVATPPSLNRDDATRIASILTSTDAAAHGPGEMSRRQPGADLSHQLDDARTHIVTIGDNGHTSRVDDRARLGTDPGPALDPESPAFELQSHRGETDHPPRFTVGPIQVDDQTSLTPDAILAKIQRVYLAGLQRCYQQGLRGDAQLGGHVALAFSVNESGRVVQPSATGVSDGFDACVANQMSSWRFEIPRDDQRQPTNAHFGVTLALQRS